MTEFRFDSLKALQSVRVYKIEIHGLDGSKSEKHAVALLCEQGWMARIGDSALIEFCDAKHNPDRPVIDLVTKLIAGLSITEASVEQIM